MSILWSDDLPYIVMMILRSLSGLKPSHTELKVPREVQERRRPPNFVKTLFEKSLVNYDAYQDYIEKFTANWDVERIVVHGQPDHRHGHGRTDLVPVDSRQGDARRVHRDFEILLDTRQQHLHHGVLDKIVESLTAEGRIRKAGRGLI